MKHSKRTLFSDKRHQTVNCAEDLDGKSDYSAVAFEAISRDLYSSEKSKSNVDDSDQSISYQIPDFHIPDDPPLDDLITTAEEAADAADKVLLQYFRDRVPVDYKSDNSPVTLADKEAEAAIRKVISEKFPNHGFIGEESTGPINLDYESKGYEWVIDPIDGTRAFVCGRPTFVTLISVLYNGGPIVGVISQCVTGERWVGALGKQTTLNGNPIECETNAVSKFGADGEDDVEDDDIEAEKTLSKCILQATTPEMFKGLDRLLFGRISKMMKNVVYGGDGYSYALLATGCGDVIMEADMKPWDYMALVPVVEGAGGYMCDWSGAPLTVLNDGRVLASSSYRAAELILRIVKVGEDELGLNAGTNQVSRNLAVNTSVSALPEDPGPGFVQSMTGFGRAIVQRGSRFVRAQISSLNARHCEVSIKGARSMSSHEAELVALVKKIAVRGRLSVSLDLDYSNSGPPKGKKEEKNSKNGSPSLDNPSSDFKKERRLNIMVDEQAVIDARKILDQVTKAGNLSSGPSVSDILQFSEIFIRREPTMSTSEILPLVREAIIKAMDELIVARRREGAILEEDILRRTRKISNILDTLVQIPPGRVDRERERLKKILESHSVDVTTPRMETELSIFADKVDFSEEVVRLRAHIEAFEIIFVGSDEPIGQRLGFLIQEMYREAHTMSSKASDAAVSHLCVLIKEEIEKIREQINNIR